MSGSRLERGDREFMPVDDKAPRFRETSRTELGSSGAGQLVNVPGMKEASADDGIAKAPSQRKKKPGVLDTSREALEKLGDSDALELREDVLALASTKRLMKEERRKMRKRYGVFAVVLIILVLASLCVSRGYYWRAYSPVEVVNAYASWFQLSYISIVDAPSFNAARIAVNQAQPHYGDIISQVPQVFKYLICGALLALSGMLYQNAFRNPIAAPSMLGVSNGVNIAILIVVMMFGQSALYQKGFYYGFAYAGGAIILLLVLLGGKWISGPKRFNVVNMLLVGTIVSQLIGIVITYVQNAYLTENDWVVYYRLQSAVEVDSIWTYITLGVGLIISIVPIVAFRFRLNLVSFSDEETRMLGVNPNALRVLALGCGSLMILTAQVNAGQVAMASLVIPFIVRAVFGAEFRKQLVGNVLIGATLLLLCGDIASFVYFAEIPLSLGSVVTVCAMPLFVWMLAVRQRSWE